MSHMDPATLHITTKIIFGEGTLDSIGEVAKELDAARALVVTDAGVAAAGHADRAVQSLRAAGLSAECFASTHENPTTDDVDRCTEVARDTQRDLLIGLGGGSSIDTARGCNFLLTNGGQMADYWGWGKAAKPMLPMIAVSTTTGTGSEMQSYALIADAQTHNKMACGDKKAAARVAILDPTTSCTQPKPVIANTGLDCIAHALETAVTTKRTPFSQLFGREAWRLATRYFRRIYDEPNDLHAQGQMLLASAYAGLAIEHSMLGAAHATANPLTAQFDVIHGQAVGVMLPHVVRFNAHDDAARETYAALTDGFIEQAAMGDAAESIASWVDSTMRFVGVDPNLTGHGVREDAIASLATQAATQWTGKFNPRALENGDFESLYRQAL